MAEEKPSAASELVSVVLDKTQLEQLHRLLNQSADTNPSTATVPLVV